MQTDKIILTQFTLAELTAAITQSLITSVLPSLPKAVCKSDKPVDKQSYLTRKEVAKQLKISLPTLDKYTNSGEIIAYRFAGRQKRYLQSDVYAWLGKGKTKK